jgi:hypothetical protein
MLSYFGTTISLLVAVTTLVTLSHGLPNGIPSVCGSVTLANYAKQVLYAVACYELKGIAQATNVLPTCTCEFFP